MNQEDVFDLMQSVPDTKYALVILLKNDNTFTHKNYGETSFLQSLGLIDAVRHEILQNLTKIYT